MPANAMLSRRSLLKAGAAAGGGLLLSYTLPASTRTAAAAGKGTQVNAWLRIDPDGIVTLSVPAAEMGQGIATSLPMRDWRQVRFEFAPANPVYANPLFGMQATGGSTAIRAFSAPLRKVGATAREMLREAAARRWKVPAEECKADKGTIQHPKTGRKAAYGELAGAAAKLPPPATVALKSPQEWKLLGKPTKRLDTAVKARGQAGYGIDIHNAQVPGLLTGTLMACPVYGGKLKSVDDAPALAVKGVKSVVRLPDAVVVLADGYWNARLGLEALKPEWDEGAGATLSEAGLAEDLRKALDGPAAVAKQEGDAAAAISGAKQKVEALYEVPYLAHATMEPMNATAHVTADGLEVWAPTQAQGPIQMFVGKALGFKPEQVKVHTTFLGGGFGRRFELDFIFSAAFASKAAGAPVKLVWSREEDMRHDFYRPAAACRMTAGLDGAGMPVGMTAKVASPSIFSRVFPQMVKDGVDPMGVEGLAETPYAFGTHRVEYAMKNQGVPVGFWRSVGNSFTAYFQECFMDELAEAAKADPVAFRMSLLKAKPRFAAVLQKAAELGDWDKPVLAGRARGVALHESFGSIVAEVVEISLASATDVKVHQVACAVDCGLVINPDTVEAQMESAIVYGLSGAAYGKIAVEKGRAQQSNFPDYPVVRMAQMPPIKVHIMASSEAHGGVGEPGTPPIAPALVNALAKLTGKRLRSLPLSQHGFNLV
jgi:isoquinoline 1-oxidoreductase beta subunit